MKNEHYLGGYKSPNLSRGLIRGYEILVTNKRIIGIKKGKYGLLTFLRFGGIEEALAYKMGKEVKATIEELEKVKKDVEIFKWDISEIEMKSSGKLSQGYLKIITRAAKPLEIKIRYLSDFVEVKKLIELFHEQTGIPLKEV